MIAIEVVCREILLERAREHGREQARRWERRECMRCGTPVETYEQVGRCIYADPCGHRQGQGRIPERMKTKEGAS